MTPYSTANRARLPTRRPPRGLLAALLVAAALALVPSLAFAAADPGATTEPATASDVSECYRLAGEQYAPPAFGGVAVENIEPEAALSACEAARAAAPKDAMLADLTGRVYQARGDFENARRFYEEAANAGNLYGKANLAWFLIEGTLGDAEPRKGIAMLQEAADAGNILAQYSLGLIYREGRGGEQPDAKRAEEWLSKAASQGHVIAMYDLAIMLRDAEGVAQDLPAALGWLEKASSFGDPDSMAALGYAYEQGLGTKVDFARARDWYEKAAALHQIDAMTNLGRLYEAGEGVAVDFRRAFLLYLDAAEAGNPTAMANLANLYEFGRGTDVDPRQAASWLARAIMAGDEDALDQLLATPGDYSVDVRKALQAFLKDLGLYKGPADGTFNPETVEALKKLPDQGPQ